MNKKILSLAIVPILIGMTGAVALSQYSGATNVNLSLSSASLNTQFHVYWNQTHFDPSGDEGVMSVGPVNHLNGSFYYYMEPQITSHPVGKAANTNLKIVSFTVKTSAFRPGEAIGLYFVISNPASPDGSKCV